MQEIFSLKSRLIFILILLSLVPVICISLLFKNKIKHFQKESLAESYLHEVEVIKDYLAAQDKIIADRIYNLAKEPVMQEVMANDASGQIKQFLEKIKTENSVFKEIIVLSDKLEVVSTTNSAYNVYLQEEAHLTYNKDSTIRKEYINSGKRSILQLSIPIMATYNLETCIGYLIVFTDAEAITQLIANYNSSFAEKEHMIFALTDKSDQSLLYSNSNLVNSFNANLLNGASQLSDIKLANQDFIFSQFHFSTELLFDTYLYLGKLASLAYQNNSSDGKLFEQTIPLIILIQLVLIIISVQFIVAWFNKACKVMTTNLIRGRSESEINFAIQDTQELNLLIEKIRSFIQGGDTKGMAQDFHTHLKKDIQQISLSLFNVRLELAKSQVRNEAVNLILEQTIEKVKLLQEFMINNDSLITNNEKVKLNSLLHKLSVEVTNLIHPGVNNPQ